MVQAIQDATGICIVKEFDRGNARIRFINGTMLYLRPANRVGKLRGMSLGFIGLDESDHGEWDHAEMWSVVTGCLRSKCPHPGIAFCTSPQGLKGTVKQFYDAQNSYKKALQTGDIDGIRQWSQYYTVTATSFENYHNPPHFYDSLKSMSKRRYDQEVLGKVLKPLNTVLDLQARHLIDWDWKTDGKNLPWILAVDWGGQDHHIALQIQIDRKNNRYVVADELVGDGMPRGKFQELLRLWITAKGLDPIVAGVDRAAPVENQKLQAQLRHTQILWMHSRDQQKVANGISHCADLLDPLTVDPKLVFSKSLAQVTTGPTAPILPAMRNYVYHLDNQGIPTGYPNKDNTNDHAIDAMRYGLMVAKDHPHARIV